MISINDPFIAGNDIRSRYAAGTAVFPGAANVHQPALTEELVVEFSRSPDSFRVNEYCKLIPVDKITDLFWRWGEASGFPGEAGRVTVSDRSDRLFNDGNDAPLGKDFSEKFQFVSYTTKRYADPYLIGYLMADNADVDIRETYARMAAQRSMTGRTQLAITALTTAGNWAGHTSAVSSIPGVTGKWDASTSARMDIKRSLDHAATVIAKDTMLGMVATSDLSVVMGPDTARKISVSQEIVEWLKTSPSALDYISGKLGPNAQYGLPGNLFGYNLIIEDAVKETAAKGATAVKSFVLGEATPFMVARPGGLVGNSAKAPNFSTCSIFAYKDEEMKSELFNDEINKRYVGRVIDNIEVQITAPASGFLFTAAVD